MNLEDINKKEMLKYKIKCQSCGQFISRKSIEDKTAKFHYIPDSQFGPEESYWECSKCI